jgi:hypothetical protein
MQGQLSLRAHDLAGHCGTAEAVGCACCSGDSEQGCCDGDAADTQGDDGSCSCAFEATASSIPPMERLECKPSAGSWVAFFELKGSMRHGVLETSVAVVTDVLAFCAPPWWVLRGWNAVRLI